MTIPSKPRTVNPLPYSDLRSDTATAPTPELFAAMSRSSLGDDIYNEDDSIKKLERYVAALCGHEAALFCASGTMTNQLALRVHLFNPPQSALVDIRSHVHNYEAGGISYHSQAAVYAVMPSNGHYLTVEDIAPRIVLDVDVHYAPTRVISLENTLNGTIMPLEEIVRIRALSLKHGIKLHLDGARLWHASIATGVSMKDFCQNFDTVSLCLSKGIGAPIGSILVGSEAVIKKARHFRLLFGGGWRQAGFLAEASLWCIKNNWPTMESTHRQAKYLERAFVQIGCTITNPVETNMIWVETTKAGFTIEELMAELAKEGIRISGSGYAARIVLHCQISDEVVAKFIEVLRNLASTPKMKISVDLTRASMSELSLRSSSPSISYYEDEEIFLPPASEPQPPRQQLLSKQSAQSSKRSASVHSRRQIAGSARFYASETALVNSAVAHRHAIYVAGDDGPDHSAKGYLLYEDMHGQSPGPRYQTANVHGPEPVPRQQGRRSNPPTCKQGGDRTRPRSAYEPTPLEYALLKERMEEEKNFRAFYLAQESGRQYGLRRSQSLDGIDAAVSATSGSASTTAVSGERGVGVEGDDDDEDERGRADMFELCTAAGTGGRAKKVGRLQYKLAHHPASVAIKRASVRLVRWGTLRNRD